MPSKPARTKWKDLPKVDGPQHAYSSQVSPEAVEWARQLLERNREALKAMDVAAGRHEGSCVLCGTTGLLYRLEPTEPESALVCPRCARRHAEEVGLRQQLCDNDPDHGPAWRNPYTRRNEYLCSTCHANSGDGVVQNRYAGSHVEPRFSRPLGNATKATCAARNVPGTKDCKGEIKPRGAQGTLLCNAHAGKQSASGDYFD